MNNSLKITALEPDLLVRLLHQAGCRSISCETLQADIANGAPINDDGTLNLIDYAAWVAAEVGDDGD